MDLLAPREIARLHAPTPKSTPERPLHVPLNLHFVRRILPARPLLPLRLNRLLASPPSMRTRPTHSTEHRPAASRPTARRFCIVLWFAPYFVCISVRGGAPTASAPRSGSLPLSFARFRLAQKPLRCGDACRSLPALLVLLPGWPNFRFLAVPTIVFVPFPQRCTYRPHKLAPSGPPTALVVFKSHQAAWAKARVDDLAEAVRALAYTRASRCSSVRSVRQRLCEYAFVVFLLTGKPGKG